MKAYLEMVACFWKNQKGQGMVEYALILALIVVVGMATMGGLGDKIALIWTDVTGKL